MKLQLKQIILAFLLIACTNLYGTRYFISPTGIDGGDGSAGHPWKTLSYACDMVGSGDVIQVLNGTFPIENNVSYLPSGASIEGYEGRSILIKPNIVLVGTGGDQHISGIVIDGNNDVGYNAILIIGRNNIKINNCKFTNFKDGNLYYASDEYEFAIELRTTHDIEICYNTIEGGIRSFYDNKNLNIHHNDIGKPTMNIEPEVGIYLCDVDNARIWNNKFKNLATHIEFSSYGTTKLKDIFIFCNLMVGAGVNSVETWGYGSGIDFAGTTKGIVRNINIINNTITGDPDGRYTMIGIWLPSVKNGKQIVIKNNIIYGFQYASIFASGIDNKIDSISVENNILFGNAVKDRTFAANNLPFYADMKPPKNRVEQNNVINDPLFIGNGDFHLKSTSPGVGTGVSVSWISSYLDDDAYFGSINIGAYNGYPEPKPIPDYDPDDALFIYPIPVRDNISVIVKNPYFQPTYLKIYDYSGKQVVSIRMTSDMLQHYPVDLSPGFYIVKVTNDYDGIMIKKIIVK